MKVWLLNYPSEEDWIGVKRRALVTVGKLRQPIKSPDSRWKHKILEARHSPIRHLWYGFMIEDIPSNIATHLARHIHAQPYISTLRNDRQEVIDGDLAPRNTPVNMILDVNAEELMVIANKRLCAKAAKKTREAVEAMCDLAVSVTPELEGLLVPMCEYQGGVCHEMKPCGRTANEMKKAGYINAEKFIEKYGDKQMSAIDLIDALKSELIQEEWYER